jgi:translocation and assembly module TamA
MPTWFDGQSQAVRGGLIRCAPKANWCGRVAGSILFGAVAVAPFGEPHAADPQAYTVTIANTGDAALDDALSAASRLRSLREKAAVAPFALVTRAREDIRRYETVLHSFGYYDGKVVVTIAGHPLDDPALAETLAATPTANSVEVKVTVQPGPLYHLGRVTIDGAVPADARAKLGLAPGQPAIASQVLAGGARLLAAMQEDGYALAKVDPPDAFANTRDHTLDVTFKASSGRRAVLGAINLSGLESVNESFVRRHLQLQSGQLYQPSEIDKARQDLAALGVFSGVSVQAGTAIAPDGSIPITFDFQERPKHAVDITGAFSTDLGGSLKTTWSDRNLFGNAEQLNLSAAATGLGGTAVNGLGYDFRAQLLKPDFLRRDQTLESNLAAFKQDLDAYDQRAVTAGLTLRRKISPLWTLGLGLAAEKERIDQEGVSRSYTLVALPLTAKYDSTGLDSPLADPTHGARAAFTATPTQSLGGRSSTFAILQAAGSTYVDIGRHWFGTTGRSVLALRGLVGLIEGASQFELPPDQRFYGGGSATVRGFKYQSIGPLFADGNPIGGTAIDAGTIEFRQRLFGDFGAAAFVDAGQVSAQSTPFAGTLRVGIGIGARYYTPIGPVRLDVALPVNRPRHGDRFEIYLGLGQAF